MTVAIVSTYPPRPCGIAVFSGDLRNAILGADSSVEVEIVAMVRDGESAGSPHVVRTIRQSVAADYAAAAADLNRRVDVVLIEHEFGIFGGEVGCHVLRLVEDLMVPIVVTLHTVLAEPSEAQSRTLRALCERAARVMVFTETARRMVVSQGLADPDRVRVVPHGAPDVLSEMAWADSVSDQSPPGVLAVGDQVLPISADQTVLSTFGLISASKGLEVTLRALPAITAAHPDVVYLIAGQTHPDVIDHEGESYRLGLARLVRELGLDDHVHFLDRFLTIEELSRLLGRTDIYLTPYRSREQIVSGALTFAVAAGCPVVSTPYFYAEDLLASGAGRLVPFGDERAMADAVLALLDSPEALAAARTQARRVGAELTWSSVGKATLAVLAEAAALRPTRSGRSDRPLPAEPEIRPHHLLRLVDDVGIVQHAWGRAAESFDRILRRRRGPLGDRLDRAGARSRRSLVRPRPDQRPRLPCPRVEPRFRADAQLHGLRPAVAGPAACRRSRRTRGLGARCRGRRWTGWRGGGGLHPSTGRDARLPGLGHQPAPDGVRRPRARPAGSGDPARTVARHVGESREPARRLVRQLPRAGLALVRERAGL